MYAPVTHVVAATIVSGPELSRIGLTGRVAEAAQIDLSPRLDNHLTANPQVEALRSIREPLATVWPAVTEAMYLLGFSPRAQEALWERLEADAPMLLPLVTRTSVASNRPAWDGTAVANNAAANITLLIM